MVLFDERDPLALVDFHMEWRLRSNAQASLEHGDD
jgi:hypothetical protein